LAKVGEIGSLFINKKTLPWDGREQAVKDE
jgi:hypothetical protein